MTHPTRAHWNFRSSSIHLPLAIHGAAAKLTKISGSGALGAQTAAYGKSGRVRGLGRCRRVEMGPSCIILYRRMIMCVCVCQTCLSAQSLQQLCMWVRPVSERPSAFCCGCGNLRRCGTPQLMCGPCSRLENDPHRGICSVSEQRHPKISRNPWHFQVDLISGKEGAHMTAGLSFEPRRRRRPLS